MKDFSFKLTIFKSIVFSCCINASTEKHGTLFNYSVPYRVA